MSNIERRKVNGKMIELKNVKKKYSNHNKSVLALNDVNIILPDKGMICIVGPSGSGKSTLLNILGLIDFPTSGDYLINGVSVSKLSKNEIQYYRRNFISVMFQESMLLNHETVFNNLKTVGEIQSETNSLKILDILKEVELIDKVQDNVCDLSGGQKQRANLARSLVKQSSLLIADEPTSNLDELTESLIFRIFGKISKQKLVVLVSHNLHLAQAYCDRIIEVVDSRIISDVEITPNSEGSGIKIDDNHIFIDDRKHLSFEDLRQIESILKERGVIELISFKGSSKENIQSDNKQLDMYSIDAPENPQFKKSLLKENIGLSLLRHVIFGIILSILVSAILLLMQLSSFQEADTLSRALQENNLSEVRMKKNGLYYGDSGEAFIQKNEISFLSTDMFDYLIDYGIEIDSTDIINPSIFFSTELDGVRLIDDSMPVLLQSENPRKDGIYITDYLLEILVNNGMYTSSEDIVGNEIEISGITLYVNGVIETDYKKYYVLKDFYDWQISSDSAIQNISNFFEYDLYNKYSRIYLEYSPLTYEDGFLVIIGNWENSLYIKENDGISYTQINNEDGIIVSEEFYNRIIVSDNENGTYLLCNMQIINIAGYSSQLSVNEAVGSKDYVTKIYNQFYQGNQILLFDISFDTLRYFLDLDYTHYSPISAKVKDISYIINFISEYLVYIVVLFILAFLAIFRSDVSMQLKLQKKKTGILLAFGIEHKTIYLTNILEYILFNFCLVLASIGISLALYLWINNSIFEKVGVSIPIISVNILIYTIVFLGMTAITLFDVILSTKNHLSKSLLVLLNIE